MHTISSTIRREGRLFSAVVVYWTRGAAWVFRRYFATDDRARAWTRAKRDALDNYGPEPRQAAE